jgi:rfaE bifunctional protein nucleotidyltransferase chain/domain
MAKAASLGDILVVGLNSDSSVKRLKGDSRPINNQDDRSFQLASLLFVHAVCLFEEDTPEQLIKDLNPNVLVKGGDYTVDQIAGADFVIQQGGSVSIIPIVDGYATTKLIDKIKNK